MKVITSSWPFVRATRSRACWAEGTPSPCPGNRPGGSCDQRTWTLAFWDGHTIHKAGDQRGSYFKLGLIIWYVSLMTTIDYKLFFHLVYLCLCFLLGFLHGGEEILNFHSCCSVQLAGKSGGGCKDGGIGFPVGKSLESPMSFTFGFLVTAVFCFNSVYFNCDKWFTIDSKLVMIINSTIKSTVHDETCCIFQWFKIGQAPYHGVSHPSFKKSFRIQPKFNWRLWILQKHQDLQKRTGWQF